MAEPHAEVRTGTPDATYDLIVVLQQALEDATRYELFARDCRGLDDELAQLFDELAASDRDIARRCKTLLIPRLAFDPHTTQEDVP